MVFIDLVNFRITESSKSDDIFFMVFDLSNAHCLYIKSDKTSDPPESNSVTV